MRYALRQRRGVRVLPRGATLAAAYLRAVILATPSRIRILILRAPVTRGLAGGETVEQRKFTCRAINAIETEVLPVFVYFPAGQSLQGSPSFSAKWFAGHRSQLPDGSLSASSPAGQFWHPLVARFENVFSGQVLHSASLPVTSENNAYVPSGHWVHSPPGMEYLFAGHWKQELVPGGESEE